MKYLMISIAFSVLALGQRTQPNDVYPSQSVGAKPAGSISVPFTSEQMTVLEKLRVDDCTVKQTSPETSACVPNRATVADFLLYVLSSDGGFFKRVFANPRYVPASVKAAQAARDAQDKALNDAQNKALGAK